MVTWVEQVHKRASFFQDQIAALSSANSAETNLSGVIDFYRSKLEEMYLEEMPLAKILDSSDLVFHADGPGAAADSPSLNAFNWICTSAEIQIRGLARSIFDISELNAKRLARKLDIRFSGFAPGSICAGFYLHEIESAMGCSEIEHVYSTLREAVRSLPIVPDYIHEDILSPAIAERMPDPALRDASFEALFKLSPTGRRGINSVDISSPEADQSTLTHKERSVFQRALTRGISKKTFGGFAGSVRQIDLDSGRFQLRDVSSIGTIRCVIPNVTKEIGQEILGNQVYVEGEYETDSTGRPRLIFVSRLKPIEAPTQVAF